MCEDRPKSKAQVILPSVPSGADPGGVFGVWRPPFQIVLILKQALQIIILIGAKIIINLLYFKAPEPDRLCLGIHVKTMH